MKLNKFNIISIFLLIIFLSSCSVKDNESADIYDLPEPINIESNCGNYIGNMVRGNTTIVYGDGWIYWVKGDVIYKQKNDSVEKSKLYELSEDQKKSVAVSGIQNIAYYDGWLYFTEAIYYDKVICKIKPDGSMFQVVVPTKETLISGNDYIIHNSKLYYLSNYKNCIRQIDLKSGNSNFCGQITDDLVASRSVYQIHDNQVFVSFNNEKDCLKIMNFEESDIQFKELKTKTVIPKLIGSNFTIYDDAIFYIGKRFNYRKDYDYLDAVTDDSSNQDGDYKIYDYKGVKYADYTIEDSPKGIYICDLNGNNQKLLKENAEDFIITEDIFYVVFNDSNKTYQLSKMDLNGENQKNLCNIDFYDTDGEYEMSIAGSWIYFDGQDNTYRISIDGKYIEKVY